MPEFSGAKKNKRKLRSAGLVAGLATAAVLVAPQLALAGAGTVTPSLVAPGGTAKLADSALTATTTIVLATAASCPNTYPTAGANGASPWPATTQGAPSGGAITFTLPSAVVAGTGGVIRSYLVCAYAGSTSTSAQLSTSTVNVGVAATASPIFGPSGGGNTVTVTGGANNTIFTGVTAPGALLSTTACPSAYGSTPALAAPVTRISDNSASLTVPTGATSSGGMTPYNICLYGGTTATSALLSLATYTVSVAVPSPASGPAGTASAPGILVTASSPIFTGLSSVGASFSLGGSCGAVYNAVSTAPASQTNVPATAARRMSNTRIAVTPPSLATNDSTYQLCVYNGNTGDGTTGAALIASTLYSTTTVQTLSAVTPSAGPAAGGNQVTVTGTGFPTTAGSITATLGGVPLTVTPVSRTAFTAIVPGRAPGGNVALVVTTTAGQATLQSAYSFLASVTSSPNTAPNTAATVDVVIDGSGFQSATWNSGSLGGAHLYLVEGTYNGAGVGTNKYGAQGRANPPVQECTAVLPLSDTQAVCSLQLNRRFNGAGTGVLSPAARTTQLTTTSGSRVVNFLNGVSRLDIGTSVVSSWVPPNTVIVDVWNGTTALLSAAPTINGVDMYATLVPASSSRSTTLTGLTSGSTSATGLTSADVGATVVFTDYSSSSTVSTTVDSVSASTGVATLHDPVTITETTATVQVYQPLTYLPVPNGVYQMTYVSNGRADASGSDQDYNQSVLSSSSVFTVAPF
ncbi:IPT/TIG domain-containing protein [Actinoplanes sp. NPDC051851]|uniref:beta strand repeat-containing protein n=1 Tax=Actinoplanes sp. NPDC051851 TaxID=3154753 RepID=UPI003441814D